MPRSAFWVSAIYGFKTRQPLVKFHHQDWVLQLPTCDARKIARDILTVAEASEQDAFMFEWAMKTVGVNEVEAAKLIAEFREHRKKWEPKDADANTNANE